MAPKRSTTSHLLAHPTDSNAQIAMLCYKNGALAREQIRDRYAAGDWKKFNELVEETLVGNAGYIGLYFPLPEIIPPNVMGEFLFSCIDAEKLGRPVLVDAIPNTAHPRAILESQFLSIRSRIADILPDGMQPLRRLIVTGGSSTNTTILQLAADVFGMQVYVTVRPENKEAASMGGAMLARFAWWRRGDGGLRSFEDMDAKAVQRLKLVAKPRSGVNQIYEEQLRTYRACEEIVVGMQKTNDSSYCSRV
jgi:xylulokinase